MTTVAVKHVNDYRNDVTVKQNGKVTATIRSVVSKDGKTMTQISKTASGRPISTRVYNKQ